MSNLVQGRLGGSVVFVSGAANGIGRASALRLAREGADLVVADREREPLQRVGSEIEALGRSVLAIEADWTDAAAVRDANEKAAPRDGLFFPALPARRPTSWQAAPISRWAASC